ncbi:hypothetical protein [Rhodopirellula europaea]|uniref:hypothetical protein n=1 Tax=Rhodopirellula europaea TaxID=1263866 RepID=UPI003D2DB395
MSESKQAWQSALHPNSPVSLSKASNQNGGDGIAPPWEPIRPSEVMPFMFRIQLAIGRMTAYAYSDLRTVDCPSPGEVVLSLYALEKIRITISGRHLVELAELLSSGRVRTLRQSTSQDLFHIAEESPAIESIVSETLTGP